MANLDDWIVVFGGHGAAGPPHRHGRGRCACALAAK
jgi:hypothetical protein